MKTIFTLSLLLFFLGDNPAKLKFTKGSLKEIVKKAKANEKLIFVFVGSDHCDLCVHTKASMKDEEVIEFYNRNFINYHMDPDNMANNLRLGNWGVSQIPTLLFMDTEKNIFYRAYGKQDPQGLLMHGSAALDSFKVYCVRKK